MSNSFRAIVFSAGVALAATTVGVSPLVAQGQGSGRPYRGLFAGGMADVGQSLVGTVSLGAGYDTNVLAAALGQQQVRRPSRSGGLVQGSAGLNYSLSRDRFQIGSSAGTSARYYPELSKTAFRTHNGGVSGSVRILDRPAVAATQRVRYQPFTFLGAISDSDQLPEGESTPPDPGVVPTFEHYLLYGGGVSASQPLTRRVSISSNYQYSKADRRDRDFFTQGASAQIRVGLSRGAGFYAGYRVNEGRYTGGQVYRNHSPLVGVDFARALSLTRTTTASFGAGSTAIRNAGRTQYRATGNASLVHQMGRTWQLSSNYARGLRFVETFDQPVFSDSVNITLGGLVNRRVQVFASAGASKGQVGFGNNRSFTTVSGNAGLAMALSRFSSLNVSYSNYRYNFDQDVQIPDGVLNRFGRHGVTANVNLWVPLVTQRRRP